MKCSRGAAKSYPFTIRNGWNISVVPTERQNAWPDTDRDLRDRCGEYQPGNFRSENPRTPRYSGAGGPVPLRNHPMVPKIVAVRREPRGVEAAATINH